MQRSRSSGPGTCLTCGAGGSSEPGRPQEEVKRQSGLANGRGRGAGAAGVGDQGVEGRASLPVCGVNGQVAPLCC